MEIADQVQITVGTKLLQATCVALDLLQSGPERIRHGEVVVYSGDDLHETAIAQGETLAVQGFHLPDIGGSILRNGNAFARVDRTGHAGHPQHLIVLEFLHGEAMDGFQFGKAAFDIGVDRGDEFQQCFGEVRGNKRVGQRRAQSRRMAGCGDMPRGGYPQAFLFNAAVNNTPLLLKFGQAVALQGITELLAQSHS